MLIYLLYTKNEKETETDTNEINPIALISFVFYNANFYLCKKLKYLYQVYDVHFYFYFFLIISNMYDQCSSYF